MGHFRYHVRDYHENTNVKQVDGLITCVTSIGDRIKWARKQRKMSQAELAKSAGVSQGTIGNAESGIRDRPRELLAIARALRASPAWLESGSGEWEFVPSEQLDDGPDVRGLVPLISWVQAGEWNGAHDPHHPGDAERWMACVASHSARTYALRVRGDSMTAAHGRTYPEGCIIFVDPEKRLPVNGERIIAKLQGSDEVTFKVYKNEDGRQWLQPLNVSHEPIRDPFKVLGTVIGKWEDE